MRQERFVRRRGGEVIDASRGKRAHAPRVELQRASWASPITTAAATIGPTRAAAASGRTRCCRGAERLFTALDEYRPAELSAEVERLLDDATPAPSADALVQLDRMIDRLGQRFEWGHIDQDKYHEEWARLQATRRELLEARERAQAPAPLPLDGLLEAWRTGDPATRRELLLAFFDEIDIEGSEVVGVAPRRDRAAEIADLLDRVQRFRRCSPGGIRGDSDHTVWAPRIRFP
ncbi:MAG: hypothetical protein E6J41_16525 [Chloroflexi bacterium]|nr:MAG: hypothetical protein E6J41_16525 [Chloroflexota bacterium]